MEAIFFVVDRVAEDPYVDAMAYKRGDVIVVKPDGWPWSEAELTNPDWRIIKFPAVTVEQAASFLAPEVETDPRNPNRMRQRRGFRLDLDGMPAELRSHISKARAKPVVSDMTAQELNTLRKRRPRRQDPNVLS